MIVDHKGIEFGYELIAALPFSYWLYNNNQLDKTVSCKNTKCFYYFSPNHEETIKKRHWDNYGAALQSGIPNIAIHQKELDWSRWTPPPLKQKYKNDIPEFQFEWIVCNKYNVEWGDPPVNYLDIPTLHGIFSKLRGRVLYNHMTSSMGYDDTVSSDELNEWDVVSSFKNVVRVQDLIEQSGIDYNLLQCLVYSNCDNYITVQGGSSILASYFSRHNLIFAVRGHELNAGSYKWYKRFNGSDISVFNDRKKIINAI